MSYLNFTLLVILCMSTICCRRDPDGQVEIRFLGNVTLDEEGMIWADFIFSNNGTKVVQILSIASYDSNFICVYPQFEYKSGVEWKSIEVFHTMLINPTSIQPRKGLKFSASLEPLYWIDQKEEYRILVDDHTSEPFTFVLSEYPFESSRKK